MNKEKKKIYRTTNFHIAVWLLMKGTILQEVDWSEDRRRAQFSFLKTLKIERF